VISVTDVDGARRRQERPGGDVAYELRLSTAQAAALDDAAQVLLLPREAMIRVAEETGWAAHENSAVAADRLSDGLPHDTRSHVAELPRLVASIYLRTGADHLAGMSALFSAREVISAPGVLARAAVENGARAVWVLEPAGDPSGVSGAPRRVARALLEELATAHYAKQTISQLGSRADEDYQVIGERWERLKQLAVTTFGSEHVDLRDDPFRWTIAGESYPRITDAVESWTRWRDDDLPGRGTYGYLSQYAHPQGFAARDNLDVADASEPTGTSIRVGTATLGKLALAGLAAWRDGFDLLTSYHGLDYDADDVFTARAQALDNLIDDF
jgi:hypothetical protein